MHFEYEMLGAQLTQVKRENLVDLLKPLLQSGWVAKQTQHTMVFCYDLVASTHGFVLSQLL